MIIAYFNYSAAIAQGTLNNGVNSNNAAGQVQYDRNGRVIPNANRQGNDSLKRRDNNEDSITIFYRYLDSNAIRKVDSSILDLNNRLPLPAEYIHLGNYGTAARSLIFSKRMKAGPDAGFHAFDAYKYTIETTPFYQTTRPYTELGYLLGSKSEQVVDILHTQNVRPNFNLAFQYRFINTPGEFKNQNSTHNNYRINGNYQSRNKRYAAYGIILKNKSRVAENGGLVADSFLNKTGLNDPFTIPTRLPGVGRTTRDFFNTSVSTGNLYDESIFMYRHHYDLGQKDSLIINDSTTVRLFYPRFRFQHTFKYAKNGYEFRDVISDSGSINNYKNYFGYKIGLDSFFLRDQWNEVNNDFSIISFPEKNNANQFLKLGTSVQNLKGVFKNSTHNYINVILHGEYRNKTRNQKWDLEANGQFYAVGNNIGDYQAQVSLKRFISQQLGSIELGFQNVNRTPSFLYTGQTSFPVKAISSINKENTSRAFALINNDEKNLKLYGEYYLISNYTYFDSFFSARQESAIFNLLHIGAEKKFRLNKSWSVYSEIHLQQTAGNPPLNVPLIYTRNRLAYEANLYKNLFLATGVEVRYNTPYKADNYSPFVGQFFYQDNTSISNRPDVNVFFNFRIKSFKAFVRGENLNTLRKNGNEIGFTQHNFSAPHYPTQSFWFRLGIWWNFVN